jgi:hypothetical protein
MTDSSSLLNNPALGTGASAPSLTDGVSEWVVANASPADIYAFGNTIPQTLGGIPGLSIIPGLGKTSIPGLSQIPKALSPLNAARFSTSGTFESVHYADDLNYHFPKFKFLFKVKFVGWTSTGSTFEYYVHRIDKPKVRFVHQDANYYNFRTRVLTHVLYEPLSITFLDEIGNSVNQFFSIYMASMSGTGQGNFGIDRGWDDASSSLPYANGYSDEHGRQIIIEQIFPHLHGKDSTFQANRFYLMNPRIETFDFDELTHEDSSAGSMANMTFSYDAIYCETVSDKTVYSWGMTDLLKGGGTSGLTNGGSADGASLNDTAHKVKPAVSNAANIYKKLQQGSDYLRNIPSALGGLVTPTLAGIGKNLTGSTGGTTTPTSSSDFISQNTQSTMADIQSGKNSLPSAAAVATAATSQPNPIT